MRQVQKLLKLVKIFDKIEFRAIVDIIMDIIGHANRNLQIDYGKQDINMDVK